MTQSMLLINATDSNNQSVYSGRLLHVHSLSAQSLHCWIWCSPLRPPPVCLKVSASAKRGSKKLLFMTKSTERFATETQRGARMTSHWRWESSCNPGWKHTSTTWGFHLNRMIGNMQMKQSQGEVEVGRHAGGECAPQTSLTSKRDTNIPWKEVLLPLGLWALVTCGWNKTQAWSCFNSIH